MATRTITKLHYSGTGYKAPRGNGWTTQSLAFKNKDAQYIICNNYANSSAYNNIIKVNCSVTGIMQFTDKIYKSAINGGHANGSCYCHKNGYVYVLPAAHGASSTVRVFDPSDNWKSKFIIKLNGISISGLAYDRITNQFYGANKNKIVVFPFSEFSKGGTCKQKKVFNKAFTPGSGYYQQDCGGHNGVIMCCQSSQTYIRDGHPAYIDCYRASDGKYIKTYTYTGELESVAVEGTSGSGKMWILHAKDRILIRTKTEFNLKGAPAEFKNDTSTVQINVSEADLRNKVIKQATSYVGSKGKHFWDYSGLANEWCVMFVKCIFNECGLSKICPAKGSWTVDKFADELRGLGAKTVSIDKAKPGDIVFYKSSNYNYAHVEIVSEDKVAKSCGGNTGGAELKYTETTVKNRSYGTDKIYTILRPDYSKITKISGGILGDIDSTPQNIKVVLDVHPEQLYRSDNYEYSNQESVGTTLGKQGQEKLKALFASLSEQGSSTIPDSLFSINDILIQTRTEKKERKSKEEGEVFGPPLPIALNPVEAPFIELTIGNTKFGTFDKSNLYDSYPNYVKSISVVKTNGSINEYTIELVHQVRPGSNPNFIDELLSKQGYNKIGIKYGDANSNIKFVDDNALLVRADTNFNFVNCSITYMIYATSSAIAIASHKNNYPETEDKPSNIIRDMLYNDPSQDLLQAFPAMRDKNFVETNNLIPSNDTVVTVEEFKNTNPISYLSNLVSSMKSDTNSTSNSTYIITMNDGYFKINQLSKDTIYDASLYEVNINFPDDNQVFNFNVDTNYSWPMAYKYAGLVSNYNYDIFLDGSIGTFRTNSSNLLDFSNQMQQTLNSNWWTQVTEFPITATLTCRGLLSPLLLLTYIKVNCLYYGSKRLTSGIYIVTGQEDTLDGSGYKTKLSLLRVAGINQHLTSDGRVRT